MPVDKRESAGLGLAVRRPELFKPQLVLFYSGQKATSTCHAQTFKRLTVITMKTLLLYA